MEPTVTVPCTFCGTLNRVDLERINDRPKCGNCTRPMLLDRPVRLNEAQFDQVIAAAAVPVVVDFYADWCQPCKLMAPALDEIAHEHSGRVLVGKLDTDKNPGLSERFGIRGIPTLIVFEKGVEARRQSGAMRREQIERFLGFSSSHAN